MIKCPECKGRGKVSDFDCYHGKPEHEPVQCASCKGFGRITNPTPQRSKKHYLELANKILTQRGNND